MLPLLFLDIVVLIEVCLLLRVLLLEHPILYFKCVCDRKRTVNS